MPIYQITGPDGTTYQIEGPDGASREDVIAAIKRQQFMQSTKTVPQTSPIEAPVKQKPSSKLRRLEDVGLGLAQGVVGVPEAIVGLADIPTGGKVGKALEGIGVDFQGAKEYLQNLKSPEQQQAEQSLQDAEGFGGTLKAAVQNPSAISNLVVNSAPSMIGGAGIARGLLSAAGKQGSKKAAILAAGAGEGAVTAGSLAEGIRQQSGTGELTGAQAGLSALGGIGTGALGVFGGKVAQALGIADVDTMLAGVASNAVKGSKLKAGIKSALAESTLEELPQSMQEKIMENVALGKPWDDGVVEAGAQGFIAGAVMGGGAGFFGQRSANKAVTQQEVQQQVQRNQEEAAARQEYQRQAQVAEQAKQQAEYAQIDQADIEGEQQIRQELANQETETKQELANALTNLRDQKAQPLPEPEVDDTTTVADLMRTPEGVQELKSNFKTYFPGVKGEERKAVMAELNDRMSQFPKPAEPEAPLDEVGYEQVFAPVFEEEDNPAGYIPTPKEEQTAQAELDALKGSESAPVAQSNETPAEAVNPQAETSTKTGKKQSVAEMFNAFNPTVPFEELTPEIRAQVKSDLKAGLPLNEKTLDYYIDENNLILTEGKLERRAPNRPQEQVQPASVKDVEDVYSKFSTPQGRSVFQPRIVEDVSELPPEEQNTIDPNTQAFVDSSTGAMTVIANRVPKRDISGVIAHEMGVHLGAARLLGRSRVKALSNRVLDWATAPGNKVENKAAQEAIKRADESGATGEIYEEEVLAYFTDIAVNKYKADPTKKMPAELSKVAGWLRELYNGITAALKKLRVNPESLTMQEVVDMMYGAARIAARTPQASTYSTYKEMRNAPSAQGAEVASKDDMVRSINAAQTTDTYSSRETDPALVKILPTFADTRQLVEYMSKNASSPMYRLIANRIKPLIKGIPLKIVSAGVPVPGGVPVGMRNALGMVARDFSTDEAAMYLRDNTFSRNGMNEEIVIHELLHDALQERLRVGNLRLAQGQPIEAHVKKAYNLANTIVAQINRDRASGNPPSETVYAAVANIDELFSYGLTNKEVQDYLKGVKTEADRTLWSEFVDTIKQLLGLNGVPSNALSDLLELADDIFSADFKEGQLRKTNTAVNSKARNIIGSTTAQQDLEAMRGAFIERPTVPVETSTEVALREVDRLKKDPTSTIMGWMDKAFTAIENRYINRAGSVALSLRERTNGAFRDATQQISGEWALAQVENGVHFAEAVLRDGSAEIRNGLVKAADSEFSVDNVFKAGKQLEDRVGVDTARDLITNSLYLWRAKAIKETTDKEDWPSNWKENPSLVPTDAQIKAAEQAFVNHPELAEIRKQFIGTKNNMVKFLRDTGFIKSAVAETYLNDDSYAPWFRIMKYEDSLSSLGNIGRVVNLQQMKALKGGEETVNDMLENMAQFISWAARSGQANYAANTALKQLAEMGRAKKYKGVPPGEDPKTIVMTYEDGKRTFWQPENPADVAAFMSIPTPQSKFLKPVINAANILRSSIVLFPFFAPAQLVMDMQRAYVFAGVKNPNELMAEILKAVPDAYYKRSEDWKTITQYGGSSGVDYNMMDPTRGRGEKFGLSNSETLSATEQIVKNMRATKAYQTLHGMSYAADAAVRLGIFRQTLKETGDRDLAAVRAMEIINFRKSGTSPTLMTLKQIIPFLGVYMQSMGVLYKAMTGRGNSMQDRRTAAKAFYGNMATLAALSSAYALMMSGDDEYEKQKGYVTDANFIIPGIGAVLPVPRELGFMYKVMPERIIDYVMSQGTDNPESAKRLRKGITDFLVSAYTPPATLPGVSQYIELKLNKQFFSGLPIVGRQYEHLRSDLQYNENTSELAKGIGSTIGASPMQIDYLLKAMGGTTAAALLIGMDMLVAGNKPSPARLAGFSRFSTPEVGTRDIEEFYELRNLYEEAANTVKKTSEEGDEETLTEYVSDPANQMKLGMKQPVADLGKVIQQFRQAKQAIINAPDMSSDEKREQLNELDNQLNEIMSQSNIRQLRRLAEEGPEE